MTLFPSLRTGPSCAALLVLSACVGAPETGPHHHRPAPPPPAVRPAPSLPQDWRDWPVAAGSWSYWTTADSSIAAFAQPGRTADLVFRCDRAGRRMYVARAIAPRTTPINQPMTVHTSFGDVQWPIVDTPLMAHGAPGLNASFAVTIRAANDPGLDKIAFSRGRFAVEAPGAAPISAPGWAEVSRVIEDCRG